MRGSCGGLLFGIGKEGRNGGNEIVVECGNFGGGEGIRSWRDWGRCGCRLVLMVSREASVRFGVACCVIG